MPPEELAQRLSVLEMLGSQVGISHRHLRGPVSENLPYRPQVYTGHHEVTGCRVAGAVKRERPTDRFHRGFLECPCTVMIG